MDEKRCRDLLAQARIARLATVGAGGPHLVPVVFASDGDHIYTAVDHKPKRTRRLQRLDNITSNPRVSLLADHYEEDWSRLWWVRADGTAEVVVADAAMTDGIDVLVAKYPQYVERRPEGPLIVISVESWTGWSGVG
ncbi:MAG: TIGR03668 family PPOX class F420-dependent oxidoreductase [Acidimicrobiia bacterium]|nr:TIGR03668 family PPOX class F420-dependent oxidoreductase [Acidimicrobiia bacterium]